MKTKKGNEKYNIKRRRDSKVEIEEEETEQDKKRREKEIKDRITMYQK